MKELMHKRTVLQEEAPFEVYYYKTTKKSDIKPNILIYGVEIEKKLPNKSEISTFIDVSIYEQEVLELIELLYYYIVTPTTLKDILTDLIDLNSFYIDGEISYCFKLENAYMFAIK